MTTDNRTSATIESKWLQLSTLLQLLLRPPGGGIFSASTGLSPHATNLHFKLYGSDEPAEINLAWHSTFDSHSIDTVSWILLGVPSSVGAASLRNAASAPTLVREHGKFASLKTLIFDVGDILSIPHLLHDELLNETSLASIRQDLFGSSKIHFPVSPLSIAEVVYRDLTNFFPKHRILALGGDHSITSACIKALPLNDSCPLGIVHFDAYPDLASTRFGLRHTYSTWLSDISDTVPLAIAQCGLTRSTQAEALKDWPAPIFQITRDDIRTLGVVNTAKRLTAFLESQNVKQVYISLDVSVTDESEVPCTILTPQKGLLNKEVIQLIELVSEDFKVVGADIVEAAPFVRGHEDSELTCQTVIKYIDTLARIT